MNSDKPLSNRDLSRKLGTLKMPTADGDETQLKPLQMRQMLTVNHLNLYQKLDQTAASFVDKIHLR